MGTRLVIARGNEALVERLGLSDPRSVPHMQLGETLSEGPARHLQRIERDGEVLYLKVYRYPWRRARRLVTFTYRPSRTRTEFEALAYLREHGLPAVEPLVYGSHRFGRIMRSCFLLTRGADGIDGDTFLKEFFSRKRSGAWWKLRRRMLDGLADITCRMHGADFFDYDLKFRNILVHERAGALEFRLLDFPKGRVIPERRNGRRAAAIRDLATLDKHASRWFSKTDRLRWFVRYLQRPLDDAARLMLREVETLRQRLLAKRT